MDVSAIIFDKRDCSLFNYVDNFRSVMRHRCGCRVRSKDVVVYCPEQTPVDEVDVLCAGESEMMTRPDKIQLRRTKGGDRPVNDHCANPLLARTQPGVGGKKGTDRAVSQRPIAISPCGAGGSTNRQVMLERAVGQEVIGSCSHIHAALAARPTCYPAVVATPVVGYRIDGREQQDRPRRRGDRTF